VELIGPDRMPMAFEAPMMETMEGEPLEEPRTPQMLYRMKLECQVPPLSILRREK
jgi:putative protease